MSVPCCSSERRASHISSLLLALCVFLSCVGTTPADAKKGSARGAQKRAACADLDDPKAAKAAAERSSAAGRREEERLCWERAGELDDRDPVPLIRLGNMAHADGKFEGARTLLEQARMLAPSDSHVHSGIAGVEYSMGGPRFQLAVQHYELAITLPGGLTVHNLNNLGISYAAVKDWGPADRTYRLALRLWGDVVRSPVAGHGASEKSAAAAALQQPQSQQQQSMHRHGASILLNMGNAYVEGKRHQEAVRAYQRLLRLSPDYAVGHYSLGRAYDRAHDSARALRSYERCLALDPHLSNAYSNMGVLFLNPQP
jgi:tetratricopeptide (TPR) repeat protein